MPHTLLCPGLPGLVVCPLCLLAVSKLPILDEPTVALKRVVLTSLPASFLATVVDGLR